MSYEEYKTEIARYAKKHYEIDSIDFKDSKIDEICQSGYRLGSYPYYCAHQILELSENK